MYEAKTALIVDDEDQIRRLLGRVLERAGYEVVAAATRQAALAEFSGRPEEFDLAILDVNMPGGGAAEILPDLIAERPDLRVILTSGDALGPELEAESKTIDAHFLRKPFVPAAFLRLVAEDTPARAERSVAGKS